jgi:hypothetical protein
MSGIARDHIPDGWLNGRQSCLRLDCSLSALFRAALYGHIRFEILPGKSPVFLRADVERYAKVKHERIPRKGRKKKPPIGEVLAGHPRPTAGTPGHS